MNNSEDFERRLRNRIPDINAARQSEIAAQNQSQIDLAQQQANLLQQQQTERNRQTQEQLQSIQTVYENYGIKSRMDAMARVIMGANATPQKEQSENGTEGPLTTVRYSIPYHTFSGKKIIKDESLSEHSQGSRNGSGPSSVYGETLSLPVSLSNEIVLSIQFQRPVFDCNMAIICFNLFWEERSLSWTRLPKWTKGWDAKTSLPWDFSLQIVDGMPIQPAVYINGNAEGGLVRAYDSYLQVTGQMP